MSVVAERKTRVSDATLAPQAAFDVNAFEGVVVVSGEYIRPEEGAFLTEERGIIQLHVGENLAGSQIIAVGVGEALVAGLDGEKLEVPSQADDRANDLEPADVILLGRVGDHADKWIGKSAQVKGQSGVEIEIDRVLGTRRLDRLDAAKDVVGLVVQVKIESNRAVVEPFARFTQRRRAVNAFGLVWNPVARGIKVLRLGGRREHQG